MTRQHVDHLRGVFARNADKTLFVDARTDERKTYGQFLTDSLRMAGFLAAEGVRPGDQVAFSAENSAELATLYFASMHAGAVLLPLNPSLHANDFIKVLQGNRARLMFVSPAVASRLGTVLAEFPTLRAHCFRPSGETVSKNHQPHVNFDFAAALAAHEPVATPWGNAADDDVFLTMPTSGSTSTPKTLEITYGGLLGNGLTFCKRLGLGPENRFYNILPMTYLGGLYNLMLIPALAEGSFVLDSVFGVPNVYGFWETVKTRGINTLWFTATLLSMLLALEDDEDLSFLPGQIRIALCGMAPLAASLKQRFEHRYGFTLYENYALSETTFLTTNAPDMVYKEGSQGLPLPGVKVEIVDQSLRPLPPGKDGQILVRTPFLMKGYRQCGETDRVNLLPDGGFLTGDMGHLDEDGELFLTGRIKDLIIRGGVNISPQTIEEVFYRIDAVEEAAAVGIPHAFYGEEVAVAIKVKGSHRGKFTVDDARRHCEATIAHYQRPKFIYLIDELPKGATNKIHKAVLRHMIQEKVDAMGG